MYAIIETGGKQFKVKEGDTIQIEKIDVEAGIDYVFNEVLAVSSADGIVFGSPYVKGASVKVNVLGNGKAKKVIVYKYKSKKSFHKKKGHRQPFTSIKIVSITK